MKILVTGAMGKLGRRIADHLHQAGFDVCGVDLSRTRQVDWKLTVASLLNREAPYSLLEGVDTVVHLANHPNTNVGTPQNIYVENVTMDMHLFQAALECGVKKIIFSSSVQVTSGSWPASPSYQLEPPPFLPTDHTLPHRPANSYALSKQAGEDMLRYFVNLGLPTGISLRFPFTVTHSQKWLKGYAKQTWQENRNEFCAFLDIRDAATLIEKLLQADLSGYHVFFPVAAQCGHSRSAEDVRQEFFADVPLRRTSAPVSSLVDCSELERLTGWKPQHLWVDPGD